MLRLRVCYRPPQKSDGKTFGNFQGLPLFYAIGPRETMLAACTDISYTK